MDSVREKIVELVFKVCRPARPDLSDPKRALLTVGLDSLDFATLLMEVEDSFKVKVPDEDLEKVVSLDDIVKYVEERRAHEA
jgi:acyl carrier protein